MSTTLLAAVLALSAQQIDVKVNVNPGEAIAGVRTFRVQVAAQDPVTQVEFYVGEELRDSDTSTPYEFKLDTIEESDGELRLVFAAYTTKGTSEKKTVTVKVDNGVAKGAQAHAERGVELLQDSKWDDAILAARVALKATPGFNPARKVMARAYLGKGALDKAQKYAEDWLASEPTSLEAAELLAGINVHRAFATVNRGGDRMETVRGISEAFRAAIEGRRKALEARLERLGTPTGDAVLPYADTAIRAGRYGMAISALMPEYKKKIDRPELYNRLAYAQMRSGRVGDALQTLNGVRKLGGLDGYGLALLSVIQASQGQMQDGDNVMREAILADAESLAVRTGQAYLALMQNKRFVLAKLVADLDRDAGARPEVAYYLFALSNAMGEAEQGRRYFQRAVVAEPLSEEVFLEEGNRSLGFAIMASGTAEDKTFRVASARAMYDTTLLVRPESYRALCGLALAAMLDGKRSEAVRLAEGAVRAAPDRASGHYVLAAALRSNNQAPEAAAANSRAMRLDPVRLQGRSVPNGLEAYRYLVLSDRIPVLPAPR